MHKGNSVCVSMSVCIWVCVCVCACACAALSSTSPVSGFSGWSDFFWLPWVHCIVKGTVAPRGGGGGVDLPKNLPLRYTSGVSTILIYRTFYLLKDWVLLFLLNYSISLSFMVYVNTPGGQKWRPTCTGSEVCMSMWIFFFIKLKPFQLCIPWGLCHANCSLFCL